MFDPGAAERQRRKEETEKIAEYSISFFCPAALLPAAAPLSSQIKSASSYSLLPEFGRGAVLLILKQDPVVCE